MAKLIPVDEFELAIEVTYAAVVTSWLSVQPDLQYIINPGTDPSRDDALLLGVRTVISFTQGL